MELAIVDPTVSEFYADKNNTGENSGFDLYLPADYVFPANSTTMVHFGVAGKTVDGAGYWLLPRSSISKTPLRFANSVGLIDPSYRGGLIVAFWNTSSTEYSVPRGTRLAQISLGSLMPFRVSWVDKLNSTSRGSGGFGSTGA
jgi:dUTP pyrophosphatase